MKDVGGLLSQSGKVGADVGEVGGALLGAEASRDLLLELGHADIALGLVVVERNTQISDKAQDGLTVVA